MGKKFARMADQVSLDIGALFNRAIRQALLAGLVMAVQNTKQDSSNAAAHWMIAAEGRSRPTTRRFGRLRDLRESATRPATPPVGRRGDGGRNAAMTQRFVRDKELREVIEKMVAGRDPAKIFYFFNALDPTWRYGENANIDGAAKSAVEEVKRIFENRMAAGQVRKKYR